MADTETSTSESSGLLLPPSSASSGNFDHKSCFGNFDPVGGRLACANLVTTALDITAIALRLGLKGIDNLNTKDIIAVSTAAGSLLFGVFGFLSLLGTKDSQTVRRGFSIAAGALGFFSNVASAVSSGLSGFPNEEASGFTVFLSGVGLEGINALIRFSAGAGRCVV